MAKDKLEFSIRSHSKKEEAEVQEKVVIQLPEWDLGSTVPFVNCFKPTSKLHHKNNNWLKVNQNLRFSFQNSNNNKGPNNIGFKKRRKVFEENGRIEEQILRKYEDKKQFDGRIYLYKSQTRRKTKKKYLYLANINRNWRKKLNQLE